MDDVLQRGLSMGRPGKKAERLGKDWFVGLDSDGGKTTAGQRLLSLLDGFDTENPEAFYRDAVPLAHRKRHGQFFTPQPIADLMCDWVNAIHPERVLDPAVGPGIFARTLLARNPTCQVTAIDLDSLALAAAAKALPVGRQTQLHHHDFLTWDNGDLFDGAIANPPYLRHHDVSYAFDIFDLIGKRNGIRLSRLTNIYGLFVLEICRRLRPGGRAAIIIPGEWVNANFGMPLKSWLLNNGMVHALLYFSHVSTQFEDALTTASILLIQKPKRPAPQASLKSVYVRNGIDIAMLRRAIVDDQYPESGRLIVRDLPTNALLQERKWDELLKAGPRQRLPGFVSLSELADSRRGISTGANEYFHLTRSSVRALGIRPENLLPCIGRAADVEGLIVSDKQYRRLVKNDRKAFLLAFRTSPDAREAAYIRKGEADRLNERYLLARRKPWYAMESRPVAPIWAAVFGRASLRFVWNQAGISNLTTFHCVYPRYTNPVLVGAMVACLNSRHVQHLAKRQRRVYGGGLLKFEPKDLLDIQIPDLRRVSQETLERLCGVLKELHAAGDRDSRRMDELFVRLDQLVMGAAEEARAAALGES